MAFTNIFRKTKVDVWQLSKLPSIENNTSKVHSVIILRIIIIIMYADCEETQPLSHEKHGTVFKYSLKTKTFFVIEG